jgi:hypothetical protein
VKLCIGILLLAAQFLGDATPPRHLNWMDGHWMAQDRFQVNTHRGLNDDVFFAAWHRSRLFLQHIDCANFSDGSAIKHFVTDVKRNVQINLPIDIWAKIIDYNCIPGRKGGFFCRHKTREAKAGGTVVISHSILMADSDIYDGLFSSHHVEFNSIPNVHCWGFSDIFEPHTETEAKMPAGLFYLYWVIYAPSQPRPLIDNVSLAGDFVGLIGGSGGFHGGGGRLLSFSDHIAGGLSGAARMNERAPNQEHADHSQENGSERRPEHLSGPIGHALLGGQIAFSAILFFGGLWLIYVGFNRAGDALDRVLDGFKNQWGIVGLWLCLCLCGAGAASGIVTYWLSVYGPD